MVDPGLDRPRPPGPWAASGTVSSTCVWPAAAYAATMLVMAGERQIEAYGCWYKVMVYPEIYLAAGWLTWEA